MRVGLRSRLDSGNSSFMVTIAIHIQSSLYDFYKIVFILSTQCKEYCIYLYSFFHLHAATINQSLTEITPHTVSVTDSFLSYIEIIRQRCYLKNNTLYLNLWLNIKNKAAIKSNDAIIWLNLHANNIDLKADGVNGGRAFFIIDDNCIKLNVFSEESDDSYLLICPVTIKTL